MKTANETATAMQAALEVALVKAGFSGLVGAYKIEGATENGVECLWLDSEYETLRERAAGFVAAYLAKHVPAASRKRDAKGRKMATAVDCRYAHVVRREWTWAA